MNENMEIMEVTPIEETNEEYTETNENSGMGTGLAMLIGGGIALATVAGVKKLKKVWANRKANQAVVEAEESEVVDTVVTAEAVVVEEPTEKKKK